MTMNMFLLIYKGNNWPLETKFQNRLEMYNEVTIAIASGHLLFFTDWVPDQDVQTAYGWSMLWFIGLNFLVNLFVIVWFAVKAC